MRAEGSIVGHPASPPAPRRRLRRAWRAATAAAVAAAVWSLGAAPRAQSNGPPSEYAVKAAFLFNFAKFVEWPADAFTGPGAPFVIGLLGSDPFGALLDDTTRDERVNGREIVVRRLKWEDDVASCHILFVSPSERRRMPQLLARLAGSSVLTVGEHDDFARTGGIIHFMKEDYRIRFAINVRAAEGANLRISSKLLSLATIVSGRSPRAWEDR